MIIVVNHLTRMHQGRICVAGVDQQTRRHVRPVTKWGQLDGRVLSFREGPFNIGHVVDLGRVEACPQTPHVEDYRFTPWTARYIERFHADDFWAMLYGISEPSLGRIFGDELRPMGCRSCGTEAGQGKASLGVLRPAKRPRLFLKDTKKTGSVRIRMQIDDGRMRVEAGVTDLRLYEADHATVAQTRVQRLARYLDSHGGVLLSVGLGRAFAARAEDVDRPVHWLQVNNIHVEERPVWGFVSREA